MKRRITILLLMIALVLFVSNYKQNNTKSFKQNGVTYAVKLDGKNINYFPKKNNIYRIDVNCNNADGKWLYDEWKLVIENITGNISCGVEFNTIDKTLFNNYIISLDGTVQGTGEVLYENGYRYEGKNPNNYVWFNNELWRIIGVFDESSHGQVEENLVKIIRANSIGVLAWHKSDTNNWSASSLKSLLNGAYLNAQDGTDSGYCYGYYDYVTANCDYREKGIKETYRGMIRNVIWYLGGYSSMFATTEVFYGYERGTSVYSERPTSVQARIGLMYPSDYGYSVLSSSCERTTYLFSYDTSSCGGQSWLYGQVHEWTITHTNTIPSHVFYLDVFGGRLNNVNAHFGNAVRPVLYLESSVYVMDGDGSMSDPYIIAMG